MIEVPSSPEQIVIMGDFALFTADELFDYWVNPDLLRYWWPEQAEVDARLGGAYKFSWPDMGWVLEGTYTAFEPGRRLGFTWSWKHELEKEGPLQVDLYFSQLQDSVRLGIFHGPFSEADAADRQGVVEGWIHFGMRLAGLKRLPQE